LSFFFGLGADYLIDEGMIRMTQMKCVAMVLAGGEGKRLAPLTHTLAKPAVPFGGHYRIIDFSLSNCVNSGIHTIGIMTQYKAKSLHTHVGDGSSWATEMDTEISMLEAKGTVCSSYHGTADAIFKNMAYIEARNPEHVLVLSADHVYKMDYADMIKVHEESGAEATIAVKKVPWREAHRFGILNVDEAMRVTDFLEKPKQPESNLASMGIYIFRWSFLKRYLLADAATDHSSHDFGKDLIPRMLEEAAQISAYPFEGYWRDVGTIESLWEAHMELLNGELSINDASWPLYTNESGKQIALQQQADLLALDSVIHPDSATSGKVLRSVVFKGVQLGEGCDIRESILMPGATVGNGVTLYRTIVGEGCVIPDGEVIGEPDGAVTVVSAEDFVIAAKLGISNIIPA
jgi:glucose-1-phosphate adenylyltransferase